jgi:hypothetical protein
MLLKPHMKNPPMFARTRVEPTPIKFDKDSYLIKVGGDNFDNTPVGKVLAAHAARIAATKDEKSKERFEKIAARVESALQKAAAANQQEKVDMIIVINKRSLKLA